MNNMIKMVGSDVMRSTGKQLGPGSNTSAFFPNLEICTTYLMIDLSMLGGRVCSIYYGNNSAWC